MAKLFYFGVTALFKSRQRLVMENTLLRYQIQLMKRKRKRLTFRSWDKAVLLWFSKHIPDWKKILIIVEPETIIRWHRKGFALYWKWKYSSKIGRNPLNPNAIHLIVEISRKNPRWGLPRIQGELQKLGIKVCLRTVDKYRYRPLRKPGQNWKTFLKNHMRETVAIDCFVVPSLKFKMLYALIVLSHDRREILHTAVTQRPSAPWTMQQLREAFAFRDYPKYLVHDRDYAFRGLHRLGVEEILTSFRSPWQNAFVERVIGTIRRECTDHIVPYDEEHLAEILRKYSSYYNQDRTHLSLNKDSPLGRRVETEGRVVAVPKVGGLHHVFHRVAA